ncbi:MAG: LLM class flavin-dependent oxidoreductase [Acidimicrobiaceae bacterium]|nr:LLM class flavin-dependent oxidoreductase [Acidimicrobiaceae bacterium]
MRFDLQINPGTAIWPIAKDAAIAAEDAGFKTFWTVDHLAGEVLQARDMPECFTLLGALAGVTKTIELGPLVVNVGNRHPSLIANSAATMQQLSSGRFVLGLGAGASPNSPFAAEQRAIGVIPPATMRERHRVLSNALDVIYEMWSPQRRSELATFPLPNPRPQVIVGVNSVGLATIAGARTNGVNVRASHDRAGEILTAARDAHNSSGIDKPFTVSVWEHYDEALVRGDDPRLNTWRNWGVDRTILLMLGSVDFAAIDRAKKYLL